MARLGESLYDLNDQSTLKSRITLGWLISEGFICNRSNAEGTGDGKLNRIF